MTASRAVHRYDQAVSHRSVVSEKQLSAFIKMLQSDSALAEKVRCASSHAAIAEIATDEGFEITEDHVIAKHELSEAELEAVSGGTNTVAGTCGGWTGCPFTVKC